MFMSGAMVRGLGFRFVRVGIVLVAALVCMGRTRALATDRHWNVASGAWGLSSNWNPSGLPGSSDLAYVDFWNGAPGFATVASNVGSPISVTILNGDTVRVGNQGSLGAQGDIVVGTSNTSGIFDVTNSNPILAYFGQVSIGNTLRIGLFSGNGTVNQNDGTVTVNQLVRVGDQNDPTSMFTASGIYNLSGIGVLNAAHLEVGYGGDSSQYPSMAGTFNLSGGVLNVSLQGQIPDPKIGGNGSTGVFNQTGGQLNSPFRVIDLGNGGAGAGIYNFSGGTLNAAGISVAGNGTLNYTGGDLYVGQLSTTSGHVLLSSGANKVLRASLLWVSAGAWSIDLNDNAMIASSLLGETMRSMISRGYNGGAWNGNGISSAAARLDAQHRTGLGYGLASEVLGASGGVFHGFSVAGSATLVGYTYYGDTNLDGKVDVTDLGNLATNWQTNGNWVAGDFNYDGKIDVTDLGLLASNWQAGVTSPQPGSFQAALASVGLGAVSVPEPTALLPAALMILGLLRARRQGRFAF